MDQKSVWPDVPQQLTNKPRASPEWGHSQQLALLAVRKQKDVGGVKALHWVREAEEAILHPLCAGQSPCTVPWKRQGCGVF